MNKRGNGFTLIELVLIMVIMGILSAYAASRLNFASYDANGCAETLKASIRLAQKLAIAQRATPVAVSLTGNCTVAVGGNSYPGFNDVSVTNTGSLTFNGEGQPSFNGTLMASVKTFTITGGTVTNYICLEAETGYVHQEPASCG
jgi:MSHA pilin protein MshC